ncbi:MAG: GxxExxY protein [Flavobacteriales bacterium]
MIVAWNYVHISDDSAMTNLNSDDHEVTRPIVGCAMRVMNVLGHGLHEKPYENALCIEMKASGIYFQQQPRFSIYYRSELIGEYVPDLVVERSVVVDTKTIERIGDVEVGRMLNYLRITGLEVGLIINFKRPRLEWRHVWLRKDQR